MFLAISMNNVFLKKLDSVAQSSNGSCNSVELNDFDIIVIVKHVVIPHNTETASLELITLFMCLFWNIHKSPYKFILMHGGKHFVQPFSISCQSIDHLIHHSLYSNRLVQSLIFERTRRETKWNGLNTKLSDGAWLAHDELVVRTEFEKVLLDALG